MRKRPLPILLLFLLMTGLACQMGTAAPLLPPTTPSPPVIATLTLAPTATVPADSGWQSAAPGLETRQIAIVDEGGVTREQLTLVRVEPSRYEFEVAYHPGEPQLLADWLAETGALLVVNGGFFTPEFLATGLIISDGVASGVSYRDFGGMFAVTAAGPQIWALAERPYAPEMALREAVQSFPVLVRGGTAVYTELDGQQARRTVVGMDDNGRVVFLVAAWGYFTLADLSSYLAASDLGLTVALNLDGGSSSGLLLTAPLLEVPAFTPLPAVIVVQPKTP